MTSLPTVMKALVKESEDQSYVLKEVSVPKPNDGELLLKVKKVAICGSDIALYKWGEGTNNNCLLTVLQVCNMYVVAKAIAAIPFVPGHEAVGEVNYIAVLCDLAQL